MTPSCAARRSMRTASARRAEANFPSPAAGPPLREGGGPDRRRASQGDRLKSLLGLLQKAETLVAVIAFVTVAGLLFADVAAREFAGNGIFAAQKIAVYATAIAGMLGFAIVVGVHGHLRPKVVDKLFPPSWSPALDRVGDLVSCGICIFMGMIAADFAYTSFDVGEVGMVLMNKLWWMQAIIPYAFFSSAFRFLIYAAMPSTRPAGEEIET